MRAIPSQPESPGEPLHLYCTAYLGPDHIKMRSSKVVKAPKLYLMSPTALMNRPPITSRVFLSSAVPLPHPPLTFLGT